MLRKAIVHIGPMKTGSTSIQYWLGRQAERLREAGFLVPNSFGARNMSRLSYMAQVIAAGEEISPDDAQRLIGLRAEIEALPDSVGSVIFSGEMIGQQLKTRAELKAFKSILGEFFDEYTIILYLRRQDELSLSQYSTALRRGRKRAKPLSEPLDYEKILNPWADAFGYDAIRPRIFDRSAMPEGDVVRDFMEAAGLPLLGAQADPLNRNPSLLPEAQIFLANLASRVRDAGFKDIFMEAAGHEIITKHLSRNFEGKGLRPSRADAIAFYEKRRDSNERVREAWFPDRASLFSEDFSGYSEEPTATPAPARMLEVAMSVLVALVTRTPGAGTGDAPTPVRGARRKLREKKDVRNRRKRHRKLRARRREQETTEDLL